MSVDRPKTYGDLAKAVMAKHIGESMGAPTRDDPFGLSVMLDTVIDEKVAKSVRWHTTSVGERRLDGIADMELVRELLARGWAVFMPNVNSSK